MNSELQYPKIQLIKKDNQRLQRIIQHYLQQIQKQKIINQQRQIQIQSLLKFNERLLNIIETEMVTIRKDNESLKPISQKSQRDSDLINPLNSLIKTKKTFAVKSQIGTKSLVETNNSYVARLQAMGKNLQNSQFLPSEDGEDQYLFSTKNQSLYREPKVQNQRKYSEMTTKIENQINNEMKKMQLCAERNKFFYEQKINQMKTLNEKIGMYKPQDKFNEISKKIPMSVGTANLVKKAMMYKKS